MPGVDNPLLTVQQSSRILRPNVQYFPYRWDLVSPPAELRDLLGGEEAVASVSLPAEHPQYQKHLGNALLQRCHSPEFRDHALQQLFPEIITPELLARPDTKVEGAATGSIEIVIDGVSVLYDYALEGTGAWIQPMGVGYEHLSLPDHDGIRNPTLHHMIFGDQLEAVLATKPKGFMPFVSMTRGFVMNVVDPREPEDAIAVYQVVRDTLQKIEPTMCEYRWAEAVIADVKRASDALESLQGCVLSGMGRSLGSLGDLVHENLTSAKDLVNHNARSPAEKARSKALEAAVQAFAAVRSPVVDYFMQPLYGQ